MSDVSDGGPSEGVMAVWPKKIDAVICRLTEMDGAQELQAHPPPLLLRAEGSPNAAEGAGKKKGSQSENNEEEK